MSHIISIHLHISQYTSTYLNISQWISISQIFQHIPTNFWQFHHISTTWIFPFLAVFPAMRWYSLHQHRWGGGSKDQGRVFFCFFWIERCRKPWRWPRFWVNNVDLVDFWQCFWWLYKLKLLDLAWRSWFSSRFLGVEFYQIAIGDQHTKD